MVINTAREEAPLIHKPQGRDTCCNRRCLHCCKCCSLVFILIAVMIFAVITVIVGIEFQIYFTTDNNVSSSSLVTQGDYILLLNLNTRANKYLTANLTEYEYDTAVDLYKVKCSKLSNYVKKEPECPFRSSKYSIPCRTKTYFRDCSEWLGKCPIDQYIYLLKEADVSLTITVNMETQPNDIDAILFVIYDDEAEFKNFLLGQGDKKAALYEARVHSKSQTFIFGRNEMKKLQSYYFFAVELIAGDSQAIQWFEVTRFCVITSYSGLKELTHPSCTLYSSNHSSCSIPLSISDHHSCIIGYRSNITINADSAVVIDWTYSIRGFDVASYALFGVGSSLFLCALLISLSCCCYKRLNRCHNN